MRFWSNNVTSVFSASSRSIDIIILMSQINIFICKFYIQIRCILKFNLDTYVIKFGIYFAIDLQYLAISYGSLYSRA